MSEGLVKINKADEADETTCDDSAESSSILAKQERKNSKNLLIQSCIAASAAGTFNRK